MEAILRATRFPSLAIVAAISLVGCVSDDPLAGVVPGTPIRLSSSDVSAVQKGLRASMKDPASAQFGPMAAVQDPDGTVTVCGYVNGKNSFGGYTGMQPFIGVYMKERRHFVTADIDGTESGSYAILSVCRRHGVKI